MTRELIDDKSMLDMRQVKYVRHKEHDSTEDRRQMKHESTFSMCHARHMTHKSMWDTRHGRRKNTGGT